MSTKINPPPLNPSAPDFNKRLIEVIRLIWVKLMGADGSSDGLPITEGGTGADNAADARTNLGAQAQDDDLDVIASLTAGNSNFLMSENGDWSTITLTQLRSIVNSSLTDEAFIIQDDGDANKQLQFELSGITTGNIRTLTIPDASGTVVLNDNTATLSAKSISLTSNTVTGTMAEFDAAVSDGNIVYQSQALGTPVSGTLTNCTGLPETGITDGSILARLADNETVSGMWRFSSASGISFGENDTTGGLIHVYGNGTGSAEGGEIRLYLAADHDAIIDYLVIDVNSDDIRIFPNTAAHITRLRGDTGNWEFPATVSAPTGTFTTLTATGAFTSLGIDDNADAVALTINSSENLLIGTTTAATGNPRVDIVASTGHCLTLSTSVANVTNKNPAIAFQSYTIAEEPVTLIKGQSTVSSNVVEIGGGLGTQNAATIHKWYTAAAINTLTGTETMRKTHTALTLTHAVLLGGSISGTPTISGTGYLDLAGDTFRLQTARTPLGGGTGNRGDICTDADYIYICTATNTWKRATLAAF